MAPHQPSQEYLDSRRIIGINTETVTDISSIDYPGHWTGEDHSWDISKFRDNFQVKFHYNNLNDASFSLIGIDASIANAFRRILIAEIPSLAIENVFVYNNTSVIQDEVLAQRLGLVPFKGGKSGLLDFLKWRQAPDPEKGEEAGSTNFDYNTVVLSLQIECTRKEGVSRSETDPFKAYNHAHVYAKDIVFKPFGRQGEHFSGKDAIVTTNPDILIAKLRHGQCIDVEMHAIKGIGSDHAKFSPVAPASYRLLPTITILKPIIGKDAEKFQKCFPEGVIGLEAVTKKEASQEGSGYEGHDGEMKAVVVDPMKDTVSRECLRHEEFKDKVKLGRVRDHFIFGIESVGQWDSDELFLESVKVLRTKCEALKKSLTSMPNN
ncbi:putative DNA-directed RNA polymerase [Venustampulla echinocandica]|uniref:DNA-directed RNA polymerases I and III subunit RPAC1 n=1 Tax=Venustampulla echinocandica TaxID=2656787 RepID=A0A370THQ9_9HELO|nr:putative DNA-directed RNA polymerase [Venustampulla echinocandica]RDL34734.1 putative DNA-directed RNA polymerase [Venustampulla echinocandica]